MRGELLRETQKMKEDLDKVTMQEVISAADKRILVEEEAPTEVVDKTIKMIRFKARKTFFAQAMKTNMIQINSLIRKTIGTSTGTKNQNKIAFKVIMDHHSNIHSDNLEEKEDRQMKNSALVEIWEVFHFVISVMVLSSLNARNADKIP